jgi:hypothetical protein
MGEEDVMTKKKVTPRTLKLARDTLRTLAADQLSTADGGRATHYPTITCPGNC